MLPDRTSTAISMARFNRFIDDNESTAGLLVEIKEDKISNLLHAKKEISNAIAILRSIMRKRKLILQLPMILTMLGTAIYMLNKLIQYNAFKHDINDKNNQLIFSSEAELSQLRNQTIFLENTHQGLVNLSQHLFDLVGQATFKVTCSGKYFTPYNYETNCQNLQFHDAYNLLYRCEYDEVQQGYYDICKAYGGPIVHVDNPCVMLTYNFCTSFLDIPHKLADLAGNTYAIKQVISRIEKLLTPNYEDFYEAFGGALFYYLLTLGLGEAAPLIVLALTLLTSTFDCLYNYEVPFTSSKADNRELQRLERVHKAAFCSFLPEWSLENFQNKLEVTNTALNPYECRQVFFRAKTTDVNECKANLLFTDALREPQLARIIFEFADLNKDLPQKKNSLTP